MNIDCSLIHTNGTYIPFKNVACYGWVLGGHAWPKFIDSNIIKHSDIEAIVTEFSSSTENINRYMALLKKLNINKYIEWEGYNIKIKTVYPYTFILGILSIHRTAWECEWALQDLLSLVETIDFPRAYIFSLIASSNIFPSKNTVGWQHQPISPKYISVTQCKHWVNNLEKCITYLPAFNTVNTVPDPKLHLTCAGHGIGSNLTDSLNKLTYHTPASYDSTGNYIPPRMTSLTYAQLLKHYLEITE